MFAYISRNPVNPQGKQVKINTRYEPKTALLDKYICVRTTINQHTHINNNMEDAH